MIYDPVMAALLAIEIALDIRPDTGWAVWSFWYAAGEWR